MALCAKMGMVGATIVIGGDGNITNNYNNCYIDNKLCQIMVCDAEPFSVACWGFADLANLECMYGKRKW